MAFNAFSIDETVPPGSLAGGVGGWAGAGGREAAQALPGGGSPASAYSLTDLSRYPMAFPRAVHGLAARSPLGFVKRVTAVGLEVAVGGLLDRLAPRHSAIQRVQEGRAPVQADSFALYAHWSPDGRVSDMVRHQLRCWRAAGFNVIFVTNANPPEGDWAAVAEDTVLRIARTNVGHDFCAWRDAASLLLAHHGVPGELLLLNDSVLGPLRPLDPLVAAWRAGGAGFFGLTESVAGGVHLQSYALLSAGSAAVRDTLAFLGAFQAARSKWVIVQRGEIGLSRRMVGARHRCAALFGYRRILAHVPMAVVGRLGPRFATPDAFDLYPLNPTHHLWDVLIERMGFPFVKSSLLLDPRNRRNGTEGWRDLIPPQDVRRIVAHLESMRR